MIQVKNKEDTALQMPDLPAPRVRPPCCACAVGAEEAAISTLSAQNCGH